jgi:hypothetical protein
MIELTNYEMWQLERYGDIEPEVPVYELENGADATRRMAEYAHLNQVSSMEENQTQNTYATTESNQKAG